MGVTKRTLKDEGLAFLTERGLAPVDGKPVKGTARPVFRRANDELITPKAALGEFGGEILMNVS